MRTIIIILLFVSPAHGQNKFAAVSYELRPLPQGGSDLQWSLTTDTGGVISLQIPDLPYSNNQLQYFVTQENAAEYGVDWNLWSAAVHDPLYTRSVLEFGGFTQVKPWSNPHQDFELERLQVFVWDFARRFASCDIQLGALDIVPVPEPPSSVLLWAGLLIVSFYFWSRKES